MFIYILVRHLYIESAPHQNSTPYPPTPPPPPPPPTPTYPPPSILALISDKKTKTQIISRDTRNLNFWIRLVHWGLNKMAQFLQVKFSWKKNIYIEHKLALAVIPLTSTLSVKTHKFLSLTDTCLICAFLIQQFSGISCQNLDICSSIIHSAVKKQLPNATHKHNGRPIVAPRVVRFVPN